jgi:hypothetical protein
MRCYGGDCKKLASCGRLCSGNVFHAVTRGLQAVSNRTHNSNITPLLMLYDLLTPYVLGIKLLWLCVACSY